MEAPLAAPGRFVARAACPCCGGPPGAEIARVAWEGADIRVVRCASCGGGFSTPVPTLAFRRECYRRWSRGDARAARGAHFGLHQQPRHAALYRRGLHVLAGAGLGGRLLDVGCAGGMALLFAQDYEGRPDGGRWRTRFEAEGLAVTDEERTEAAQVTGCPVHAAQDLPRLAAGRYAAVTAFNTLEHVDEPAALLAGLRRVLAPGGALFLAVPNNAFLFARLRAGVGRALPDLEPYEHLNHFTPRSLSLLLRRAGFARVRLLHDAPAGTLGFFHRRRARDVARWLACVALAVASARRVWWHPQLLVLARA